VSDRWRNWAGDVSCRPRRIVAPATVEQIVAEVRAADAIRVAGAGHSFSPLVATDGVLLRLDAMDRILDVRRHEDGTASVRVQAGIRLQRLSDDLDRHGLALPNLGDIDVQTLAGAVATGTDGTGARLLPLHAQIECIELVDGAGMQRTLDAPDELRAARLALGALGVVTALTLRCVPAFTLRGVDEPHDLAATLARLEELTAANEHFELFIFPHASKAITRTNTRVDDAPEPPGRAAAFARDIVLANGALEAVSRVGRARPAWIPSLNRFATWAAGSQVRGDRSDRVFASPRHVRFTETEWAVPKAAAAQAVRAVLAAATRHAVNFPLELRFGAADDTLLSPSYGRETAYISAHVFRGMPVDPFFDEVQAVALHHDGRPHWGKRHGLAAEDLRARYPRWAAFAALRDRVDPGRRFANVHLERVLGA
jgi:L-gulono-1,4-lactone dehydrogenase